MPTEQMAAYYGRRADISLIISPKPHHPVRTGRATPIPGALQRRTDRRLEEVTSAVRTSSGGSSPSAGGVGRLPTLLPPRRSAGPSAVAHEGTVHARAGLSGARAP